MLGGQNPITLEYQIYPPPIDTLVTGMALASAAARERKPPRQEGLSPTWRGGLLALGFYSSLALNITALTHDSSLEASLQCESLCVASDHQPV